jgi:hypothetical protein
MFEQQQVVLATGVEQRLLDRERLAIGVSRISLMRLRNPAA